MITLLILFAMVPVLNSMFQLMNTSIYYTRWFYMPVLMFSLATVRALEDNEANWNRAVAWCTGLTAGAALLIGLMPHISGYDKPGRTVPIRRSGGCRSALAICADCHGEAAGVCAGIQKSL